MLNIVRTTTFKKEYKKSLKQGKSRCKIEEVLYNLAYKIPLDQKFRDHKLSNNYLGKRECHIEPDWLLIYEVTESELILYRVGSHSELF